MILTFAFLFVLIGFMGVYGVADGYVFMILTLFLGSIGGLAGIGCVLLIMTTAAFSFLLRHVAKCVRAHTKVQNVTGALIPHIFIGYVVVSVSMIFYVT